VRKVSYAHEHLGLGAAVGPKNTHTRASSSISRTATVRLETITAAGSAWTASKQAEEQRKTALVRAAGSKRLAWCVPSSREGGTKNNLQETTSPWRQVLPEAGIGCRENIAVLVVSPWRLKSFGAGNKTKGECRDMRLCEIYYFIGDLLLLGVLAAVYYCRHWRLPASGGGKSATLPRTTTNSALHRLWALSCQTKAPTVARAWASGEFCDRPDVWERLRASSPISAAAFLRMTSRTHGAESKGTRRDVRTGWSIALTAAAVLPTAV